MIVIESVVGTCAGVMPSRAPMSTGLGSSNAVSDIPGAGPGGNCAAARHAIHRGVKVRRILPRNPENMNTCLGNVCTHSKEVRDSKRGVAVDCISSEQSRALVMRECFNGAHD